MTHAAPSRRQHTMVANLLWFAATFALAHMALSGAAPFFLSSGAALFGPIFVALLAFAVATFVAGTRFTDRRSDLRAKRATLLISYVALAATLVLAVPALMLVALLLRGVTIGPEASHSLFGTILLLVATLVVTSPLNGAIAWFILGKLDRSRENP